ncbi:hypothetical protein [Streptomyces purpureus]|uniref:Uncharacterized protein n=1 Tax=Streptomyces purpureus TaxID=1951 RepID=A0A918LPG1_9ACTN|nr:hypothetical protein [Streptomyces purpureus]GGT31767.1 hypothetical protein GCM10014713_26710 [Streptomyces purpureus]
MTEIEQLLDRLAEDEPCLEYGPDDDVESAAPWPDYAALARI